MWLTAGMLTVQTRSALRVHYGAIAIHFICARCLLLIKSACNVHRMPFSTFVVCSRGKRTARRFYVHTAHFFSSTRALCIHHDACSVSFICSHQYATCIMQALFITFSHIHHREVAPGFSKHTLQTRPASIPGSVAIMLSSFDVHLRQACCHSHNLT